MRLIQGAFVSLALLSSATAFHLGQQAQSQTKILEQRQVDISAPLHTRDEYCENSATSRTCWGDYSASDDWYTTIFDTGDIKEYWLVARNSTLAPDVRVPPLLASLSSNQSTGIRTMDPKLQVSTIFSDLLQTNRDHSGTIPGPTITANWGDTVIVHVTNNVYLSLKTM